MSERYTLRYTVRLVPGVCGILSQRGGVFTSPVSGESKAKLRVLSEVMPIALLVEKAGAMAVNENGMRLLEMKVRGFDQRCGLVCGDKREVVRYVETVCGNDPRKRRREKKYS